MKFAILVILPLVFFVGYTSTNEKTINTCQELKWADELKVNGTRKIDPKWLYKKIPVDSAKIYLADQLEEGINHVNGIKDHISKNYKEWANEKWNMLEPEVKEEDEIWLYSTPEKYWDSLLGEKGLLVIRNCTIIGNIIPIQN